MLGEQLTLPGFVKSSPSEAQGLRRARPKRKPFKLFLALLAIGEFATQISALGESLDRHYEISGEPLRKDRFHITVTVLGDFDDPPHDLIVRSMRAGESMQVNAFEVVFDQAMTFAGAGAYVLLVGEGSASIKELCGRFMSALLGIPMGQIKIPPFAPHMTLSYKGRLVSKHSIEPIRWKVTEFVLINSHVGKTRHEIVGRWPLGE